MSGEHFVDFQFKVSHTNSHNRQSLVGQNRSSSVFCRGNIVSTPIRSSVTDLLCHPQCNWLESSYIWLAKMRILSVQIDRGAS